MDTALPARRPGRIANTWFDLTAFLRRPDPALTPNGSVAAKIGGTLVVLGFKLIAVLLLSVVAGVLDIDPKNVSGARLHELYSPLGLLLVGALILPLLEETGFRLALRFRPIYLALALGVFAYYLLSKAVFQTRISDVEVGFGWRLGLALAVAAASFALLTRAQIAAALQRFWARRFDVVVYASALLFAAIHAFNYVLTPQTVLLLPLITAPQLIGGLCYGYIRIRYGFLYSYGFHALSNALALGLSLLAPGD